MPAHVAFEAHPLTAAEVRRMLAATAEPLFRVAVTTGMRRGELLGLRWQDIDLDRATLAGRRATTKTSAGRRTVRLDAATVALLRPRRGIGEAPVFPLPDGRPWTPKHVFLAFKKLKEAAELPTTCGSTTCATATRRSRFRRASRCTSCRSSSATRTSASRSTSTRT